MQLSIKGVFPLPILIFNVFVCFQLHEQRYRMMQLFIWKLQLGTTSSCQVINIEENKQVASDFNI